MLLIINIESMVMLFKEREKVSKMKKKKKRSLKNLPFYYASNEII